MPRKTLKDKEKPIDRITPEDMAIFDLSKTDPTHFTINYLKSPGSGTYWAKDYPDEDRVKIWEQMRDAWEQSRRPQLLPYGGLDYETRFASDSTPIFFYNHGPLWQDWQKQIRQATQPIIVVVGGVGSGKTKGIANCLTTNAALYPNYKGMLLSPSLEQSKQTWDFIKEMVADTPYNARWVSAIRESPHPEMIVKNNFIGESAIRIRSLQDHKIRSILTFELDELYVDQAEAFIELEELMKAGGTRLRGRTERGRPRIGKMVLIANAAENEELWYYEELAKQDPENYLFLNPWTEHNPYLSKRDIANIRRLFKTQEEAEVWMHGKRPRGAGEIFTGVLIGLCTDTSLNRRLEADLDLNDVRSERGVAMYHYEMPPEKGHAYYVIADGGSDDPPHRNAACVMTWDLGDYTKPELCFPKVPVTLVGFNWVFGRGNPQNYLAEYVRTVERYHASGNNGFDSTGLQAIQNQLVFSDLGLKAEGIPMTTQTKFACLSSARYFMGKGLIRFPFIPHLAAQMSRYKLPDDKIPQDLVMTLIMSAWFLHRYYWEDPSTEREDMTPDGQKVVDRYNRGAFDRYQRGRR
jgi:hypothetical protein